MNDEQLTRRAAEVMGYDLAGAEWKDSALPGGGMGPALRLGDWYEGWPYRPLHDAQQNAELARKMLMRIDHDECYVSREVRHSDQVNIILREFDPDKEGDDFRAVVECACG